MDPSFSVFAVNAFNIPIPTGAQLVDIVRSEFSAYAMYWDRINVTSLFEGTSSNEKVSNSEKGRYRWPKNSLHFTRELLTN